LDQQAGGVDRSATKLHWRQQWAVQVLLWNVKKNLYTCVNGKFICGLQGKFCEGRWLKMNVEFLLSSLEIMELHAEVFRYMRKRPTI
jgi:hypothetical protein